MVNSSKTGIGYYVDRLVYAISQRRNNDLSLSGYYFNFFGRSRVEPPDYPGITYLRIWLLPSKLLSLFRRMRTQPPLSMFVRHEADTVLFTNYVSLPTPRKTRVVLVVYDLGFLDHPQYVQPVNLAYLRTFCPKSIERADAIVTISEFTKQRVQHHFPNLNTPIVVTPIPPAAASQASPAEAMPDRLRQLGITPGKFFLFLGTIEPRKNLENLVSAYAALPASIRGEYALVLAGGRGWMDEEINTAINSQIAAGANIIRTGYISDTEKSVLYGSATCLVMPSHYEGFGMPILEAMQHNAATCLSDIPVFREVAQDAALYFDKDSPAAIAKSMETLATDHNMRTELIEKGRQRLSAFSWQENADKVIDLL